MTKKFEFKAWGCPYVFKTWNNKFGPPSPDLWVYAQKNQVSIKLDRPYYNDSCAVLSPKKVKDLIKLLRKTL